MSTAMNFSAKSFKPRPPDKGAFPLDHFEPDWASHSLGIFICLNCSGIHRNIPQVSKVKSVRLDDWDDAQVEFMASNGNNVAKAKYESKLPPFYYKPTFLDCQLLREQWIRAKYERKEFIHSEKQEPYSAGYREGFLWKRGRDNGQFLSRKFVLSEREGALKYFNKNDVSTWGRCVQVGDLSCESIFEQAKEPKAIMKIEHLNATFQPAKIGNPHGLQITYLKDNSTRNIFVYHEDGKLLCDLSLVASSAPQCVLTTNERLKPAPAPCSKWEALGAFVLGVSNDCGHLEGQGKACVGLRPFQRMFLWSVADMYPPPAGVKEIVDWFNAIRAARFHYLQVAFPGASDVDLVPKLSRNYLKEGYMEKTGPKQTEGFKKRWFTMDDRRLMYFKDPLDAFARGEVFIGSKENSYKVLEGLPPSTQGNHWQHGITIVTPDRKFLFACETKDDQLEWITTFQKVISRPMLPQEYAVEAHFKHKP
ncbi:hypothetical protein Q9233_004950 [Columba guinea]|nr:hypothetical protein Q9233_004950 [Columba guinea]